MKEEGTKGPSRSSGHPLLSGSKWASGTEPEPCWHVTCLELQVDPEPLAQSKARGDFVVQVGDRPCPRRHCPGQPSSLSQEFLPPDYCSSHQNVQIASWQLWPLSHLCQLQPQGLDQVTSLWLYN